MAKIDGLQPPVAMRRKLVSLAAAAYFLLDGAAIKRQQSAHDRLNALISTMQRRWPEVDLESQRFHDDLLRAAKAEADKKVLKGAGYTY